jgi:hypothetical protein
MCILELPTTWLVGSAFCGLVWIALGVRFGCLICD